MSPYLASAMRTPLALLTAVALIAVACQSAPAGTPAASSAAPSSAAPSASASASPSASASESASASGSTPASASGSASAGTSVSGAGMKVALVSTQKAGDNGPVDDMVKALDRAKTEFGVTTTFIEATDPSTYESQLRNLANAGTNIIVTTFPGMQAPLAAVAPEYPNVRFVHIFGDPDKTPVSNLRRVAYEIHPAFYLGGILAATLAKGGKIGYIGGASLPSLAANYWAYKAGAQAVNPNIAVQGAWAGSFEDPAKGLEIATTMYSGGVQVIQTDSAATSNGVLDAAKQKNTWMIKDSDPSQIALAPDRIVAVSFLKFGQSLYEEVKAALSPGWTGGPVSSGIKQDITGLQLNLDFPTKTTDTEAAARFTAAVPLVEAAKAGILSGALKVPFNTDQNLK